MTRLAEEKRWLDLAEAATVARRTERTLRNWVRDGVLKPAAPGIFARDAVLAAAKQMTNRRWRPTATDARIVRAAPGVWISVTPCGPHISTLNAGLVALTCKKCSILPAEAPTTGSAS
ncbi:helix-turn-helix domain-containing protein [Microbacterium galbinum]|uniref:helix-turn-helix domain-containing protein n=1 Tax=Microbacterium galbinum TaxID=2851646 RepID=UPI001FFCCD46|nr:helix-turn-helix domain-containing protein [Microbacterium galbinum]MCK2031250.1 helix-turn-helix domain-containing protein [Microbacterium galbinum]